MLYEKYEMRVIYISEKDASVVCSYNEGDDDDWSADSIPDVEI